MGGVREIEDGAYLKGATSGGGGWGGLGANSSIYSNRSWRSCNNRCVVIIAYIIFFLLNARRIFEDDS